MSIRLLQTTTEPSGNQFLLVPYEPNEKVEYRGEIENDGSLKLSFTRQFIKIYRFKYKREESMSRHYFTKLGKWEFDKN